MANRTYFEELILQSALQFKNGSSNSDLIDLIAEDRIDHNIQLKNVCAKLTPELSDSLDEVVGILGISKRKFIEAALIEAVRTAKHIMFEDVDMFREGGSVAVAEVVEK